MRLRVLINHCDIQGRLSIGRCGRCLDYPRVCCSSHKPNPRPRGACLGRFPLQGCLPVESNAVVLNITVQLSFQARILHSQENDTSSVREFPDASPGRTLHPGPAKAGIACRTRRGTREEGPTGWHRVPTGKPELPRTGRSGYLERGSNELVSFNHPCRKAYCTMSVRLRRPSFSATRTL